MMNTVLFISGPEIFIVLAAVLLLFGSKRIPEIAKGLGKGLNEFKRAADDIKREIHDSSEGIDDDIKEIKDTFNKD
jgi:sec-independent protein translocase protein TatA